MKVTSTKTHFIDGHRVRPGQVFEIPDDAKLASHMTRVDADAPVSSKADKSKASKARDAAPQTFSEIAKKDAADLTPKGA